MYAIPLEEARLHREEKIEKAQRLLTEAVERLQSGEDWQAMLKDRLHADGKDRARQRRVEEKQRTIQGLRLQLATAKNEDLEPSLDEEIKRMEGELGKLAEKRAARNSEKVSAAKAAKGGKGSEE